MNENEKPVLATPAHENPPTTPASMTEGTPRGKSNRPRPGFHELGIDCDDAELVALRSRLGLPSTAAQRLRLHEAAILHDLGVLERMREIIRRAS